MNEPKKSKSVDSKMLLTVSTIAKYWLAEAVIYCRNLIFVQASANERTADRVSA